MLIIHPDSACDICLENYNWIDKQHTPGVIPCGHVFCISCLTMISPKVCPMCRRTYLPERVKRVHADRLESGERDRDDLVLLRRMVEAALRPTPEFANEVHNRLKSGNPEHNVPIAKIQNLLKEYINLHKFKKDHNEEIQRLYLELEVAKTNATNASAETEQLQHALMYARMQPPQNGHVEKPSKSRRINDLQQKVAELTHALNIARIAENQARNPLPEPPAPISISQVPSVPQYLASIQSAPPSQASFPFPPTANPSTSSSSGYQDRRVIDDNSPPKQSHSRKTSAQKAGPQYNIYSNVGQYSEDDIGVKSGRTGIIPGASPTKRFIPPAPPAVEANPTGRLGNAAAYISGYGEGDQEGYHLAASAFNGGPDPATGYVPSAALAGSVWAQTNSTPRPSAARRATVQVDSQTSAVARGSYPSTRVTNPPASQVSQISGSSWGTVTDQSSIQAGIPGLVSFGAYAPTSGNVPSNPNIVPNPMGNVPSSASTAGPNNERLRSILNDPVSSLSRESLSSSVQGTSSDRSRRHRRPATSAVPEMQSDTEPHVSSSSRRRPHGQTRRSSQTMADTSTLVAGDPRFAAQPPQHRTQLSSDFENALGLNIPEEPQAGPPQIIAPTPRSSYRPFLNTYSDGPLSSMP